MRSVYASTHKTPLIQRWLAKRPRYHLHFTPTSASWLNLVDSWFALLTARQLRRGAFHCTRAPEQAIRSVPVHLPFDAVARGMGAGI
jgi:hypothetical protein